MQPDPAVPILCRALVWLAGHLAPAERRREWREHWRGELRGCWAFLQDRPELNLSPFTELFRYSLTAFGSAWRLRGEAHGPARKRFLLGWAFPFAAVALLVAIVGAATAGFAGLRSLLFAPPYAHHQQLVTLWQDFGALGRRIGVPAAAVREWDTRSTQMAGFAAYYYRRGIPLARPIVRSEWVQEARVTPDLFAVLGVKAFLGRAFEPLDAYSGSTKVVLSYRLWRSVFDGDPGIIGQTVTLNRQPAIVMGVMPRDFWFPSRKIELWSVMPLYPDTPAGAPYLLNVIARLKTGASPEQARAELRRIGASVPVHWNGALVRMSSLREAPWRALRLFIWAIPITVGAALLAGRWQIGRKPWRFWVYLAAKSGFVAAALTAMWLEIGSPFAIGLSGWADPAPAWLMIWWFFTATVLLVWWALRDQKRRCPVCLGRLEMPVTIGSYGSPMLDPVSTELICPRGHGALYVPGGLSTGAAEWRPLDSSWRDFFPAEKQ
jgi:hypothetical protein